MEKIISYSSFALFILILFLSIFNVISIDKYTFVLTIFLTIPFISKYIESLNIFGNKFYFRKSIEKIEQLTNKALEEESSDKDKDSTNFQHPMSYIVEQSQELLEKDPTLAIASLRIGFEKSLRNFCENLAIDASNKYSLKAVIKALEENGIIKQYQVDALEEIINVANKVIHGKNISYDDAKQIIELAERLIYSFPIGYVPDFKENQDYEKQGFICEWEHCIEFQPLKNPPDDASCKIFGHDCPGGAEKRKKCNKILKDIM